MRWSILDLIFPKHWEYWVDTCRHLGKRTRPMSRDYSGTCVEKHIKWSATKEILNLAGRLIYMVLLTLTGLETLMVEGLPMGMCSIYSTEKLVGWVGRSRSLHCRLLRRNTLQPLMHVKNMFGCIVYVLRLGLVSNLLGFIATFKVQSS